MTRQVRGNKAIQSGMWFTVSNFLMRGMGLITTPIFTRLMTKAEFGEFNNFQTWTMILLYITSLDLEGSLIRACHEFRDDLNRYVHSMIALSILSTGIFWIGFTAFSAQASKLLSIDAPYIHCMFFYLMFCPAVNIFQSAERFKYNYKWTVASSMVISVGASLLSVILVLGLENKLQGRILGFVVPTAIVGFAIAVYYAFRSGGIRIRYWKYALPITLPYIPHLLSMYLLSNMDRVMIRRYCGSEDLALYSLAYTCGMVITVLLTSINSAYSPWLAEKLQNRDYDAVRRVSVPYVLLFSAFAVGVVLVTPELLLLLGGQSYMQAKYVMPPVAAGCLLQYVYCMYVNIEQYEKKTVGMAFASITAALVNYVLNAVFIRAYGYVAAAYTTYVGYFVLLCMHVIFVRKMGMAHVYRNRIILGVSISVSIIMFLFSFILDQDIIRYILLFAYAVLMTTMLWKNRAAIMQFIRR